MKWDEVITKIAQWQRKQFPETTTYGAACHLHKESLEIINEAMNKRDDPEEWADALFMSIQGGWKASGSLEKFLYVVAKKLQKNEKRTWPNKPDKDNVYEHTKEPFNVKHDRNLNG